MDDARKGYLPSLILFLLLTAALADHASGSLEYVTPEQRAELAKKFEEAEFSNHAEFRHRQWTCDMYGMRTHLQVKRGVKLYRWNDDKTWTNSGAQIVSDYKLKDQSLIGIKNGLEDRIKMTGSGQLIARLSITQPESRVLAYSVCTATP